MTHKLHVDVLLRKEFYTKERTCRLGQGKDKKRKDGGKKIIKKRRKIISRKANKAAGVTNYIIVHVKITCKLSDYLSPVYLLWTSVVLCTLCE